MLVASSRHEAHARPWHVFMPRSTPFRGEPSHRCTVPLVYRPTGVPSHWCTVPPVYLPTSFYPTCYHPPLLLFHQSPYYLRPAYLLPIHFLLGSVQASLLMRAVRGKIGAATTTCPCALVPNRVRPTIGTTRASLSAPRRSKVMGIKTGEKPCL